jgi:hypothetical protein
MLPSGAYATNDSGGGTSRRKNTVFSLAALETLENTNGFRSGVFGLKVGSRSNSVQRARLPRPISHRKLNVIE